MKTIVKCPKCKVRCKKVIDVTMLSNEDMLFQCPVCNLIISVLLENEPSVK